MSTKPKRPSSDRTHTAAARPTPGGAIATARRDKRGAGAAARRDAILDAALDEFSARGFAAARLDDVARRAGVAKGTIYLYFTDKESLLQDLVRTWMMPVVGVLEAAMTSDLPARQIFEQAVEIFVREIYSTKRGQVMRLIISEGQRFPEIAEFYYREVLTRLLKAVRTLFRRALERGELADDALVRFPQLLGAPAVVAIIWSGLFERFEPLDVRPMMHAYFTRLLAAPTAPTKGGAS